MTRTMNYKEAVAVLAVLVVLLGTPLTLWYWRHDFVTHHPAGTKVVTLTAIADRGMWTQDDVVGWNYWWRKPVRAEDIPLQQGDHVVLHLRSVDVLHSFAIPLMHLGPVEVPAGHTVNLEFDANRGGVLTFLCWQVCSPDHQKLSGRFVVKGGESQDSW